MKRSLLKLSAVAPGVIDCLFCELRDAEEASISFKNCTSQSKIRRNSFAKLFDFSIE